MGSVLQPYFWKNLVWNILLKCLRKSLIQAYKERAETWRCVGRVGSNEGRRVGATPKPSLGLNGKWKCVGGGVEGGRKRGRSLSRCGNDFAIGVYVNNILSEARAFT